MKTTQLIRLPNGQNVLVTAEQMDAPQHPQYPLPYYQQSQFPPSCYQETYPPPMPMFQQVPQYPVVPQERPQKLGRALGRSPTLCLFGVICVLGFLGCGYFGPLFTITAWGLAICLLVRKVSASEG